MLWKLTKKVIEQTTVGRGQTVIHFEILNIAVVSFQDESAIESLNDFTGVAND